MYCIVEKNRKGNRNQEMSNSRDFLIETNAFLLVAIYCPMAIIQF